MTKSLTVVIDLSGADPSADREVLEATSLNLADEMRSGDLVDAVQLVRQAGELPTAAKSGMLAFVGGLLTAEISRENLKKTIGFLGNRFYGEKLTLNYKVGDREYSLDYRDPADLDNMIAAVEKLEHLRIQVRQRESSAKDD